MTDAISLDTLKKTQKGLQKTYEKAQKTMQDAKVEHDEKKAELHKFNERYGRVLQMMNED